VTPIIARNSKRDFAPAPEGIHSAVCVDVLDHGVQPSAFGPARKVEVRWLIEERNPNNGKPFLVSQRYRLSLHPKAKLCQHLEGWRNKSFTPQDAEEGVDLERLIGTHCQLQIVHNPGRDGELYANVQAVLPLGKGMERVSPAGYVRVADRPGGDDTARGGEPQDEVNGESEPDEKFPF